MDTSVPLSQPTYLRPIINQYLPSGAKPMATRISPSERPLNRYQSEPTTNLQEYNSAMCSLMYAPIITRPDVVFSVCCLSQFLADLSPTPMRVVKTIFWHLANTSNYKLIYHYSKDNPQRLLVVYSDSSNANCLSDHRSIS